MVSVETSAFETGSRPLLSADEALGLLAPGELASEAWCVADEECQWEE